MRTTAWPFSTKSDIKGFTRKLSKIVKACITRLLQKIIMPFWVFSVRCDLFFKLNFSRPNNIENSCPAYLHRSALEHYCCSLSFLCLVSFLDSEWSKQGRTALLWWFAGYILVFKVSGTHENDNRKDNFTGRITHGTITK